MSIEDDLDNLWNKYCTGVEETAEKVFNSDVKPWLMRHNYSFRVVWGDWLITNDGEFVDDVPEEIATLLDLPVKGMIWASLGSLMPDMELK